MAKRINWTQAQKDYVEDSTLSYADIADRYGISKKQVGVRAKADRWIKRRQTVHETSVAQFLQNQADHIAKINTEHLAYYRRALNLVAIELERLESVMQNSDYSVANGARLHQTARTMQLLIEAERKILGLNSSPVTSEPPEPFGWAEMVAEAHQVVQAEERRVTA